MHSTISSTDDPIATPKPVCLADCSFRQEEINPLHVFFSSVRSRPIYVPRVAHFVALFKSGGFRDYGSPLCVIRAALKQGNINAHTKISTSSEMTTSQQSRRQIDPSFKENTCELDKGNGRFYIVDGQHRLRALQRLWEDPDSSSRMMFKSDAVKMNVVSVPPSSVITPAVLLSLAQQLNNRAHDISRMNVCDTVYTVICFLQSLFMMDADMEVCCKVLLQHQIIPGIKS